MPFTLPTRVVAEDDYFVATCDEVGQYGTGDTEEAALAELQEMIEDYWDMLLEDEGKLSKSLARHLETLRNVYYEDETERSPPTDEGG